ncbi:MAG: hypothetical protein HUU47_03885 [Bacteroidetes bacterium]|nr:hypothetical protein [Bacteroidota bacterium]
MKKLSLFLFAAILAFRSFGQFTYDICYDPTCIYTYPLLSPPPGYVINPCLPSPPPVPYNAPIECMNVTIINETDCEMDFWWEYDLSNTGGNCGGSEIIPAYWWEPWEAYSQLYAPCVPQAKPKWPPTMNYNAHLIPGQDVAKGPYTLKAYQMKWSCDDYDTCICPSKLRMRLGDDTINITDQLLPEALPYGLPVGSEYILSATCNGGTVKMEIVSSTPPSTNPPPCVNKPGLVTLRFKHY